LSIVMNDIGEIIRVFKSITDVEYHCVVRNFIDK
jgi:hypothetical protein